MLMRSFCQLFLLVLLLLPSCRKAPLFSGVTRASRTPPGREYFPEYPAPDTSSASGEAPVWLTALCQPGPELVVWKNGRELLRLTPASPEKDRHRVRGGHLWEDANRNGCTLLYKDGELLYSFEGEEYLRGLLEGPAVCVLSRR